MLEISKINGTINYALFKSYSQALVNWMSTFSPLNRKLADERVIYVMYGNPERVFAQQNLFKNPNATSNEKIRNSIIAVYLTGFTPEMSYNIPPSMRFYHVESLPNGMIDPFRTFQFSKPQTFSLTYSVEILVQFKEDMDYVMYNIMRELDGGKTKWILLGNTDCLNGYQYQYIPFRLDSATDSSTNAPGDAADITVKYTLNFTVPNAYLPISFLKYMNDMASVVNYVNIELEQVVKGVAPDGTPVPSNDTAYNVGDVDVPQLPQGS